MLPIIQRKKLKILSIHSSIASQGSLRRRAKRQDSEISTISQKEEEKKAQEGKLIEEEKAQTGGVKWEVYKHYIKSIGIKLAAATIILNFAFQAFQIGSNLWLTKWSNDREVENNHGKRDMYLGVYGALGFGQGKLSSLRNILAHSTTSYISLTKLYKSASANVKENSLVSGFKIANFCPNKKTSHLKQNLTKFLLHTAITVYFQFLLVSLGCLYSSKIMHNILMTFVMHWPMENFDTTPLGRVLNRFSKDVDTIDNVLPHLLRAFFSQAFAVWKTFNITWRLFV